MDVNGQIEGTANPASHERDARDEDVNGQIEGATDPEHGSPARSSTGIKNSPARAPGQGDLASYRPPATNGRGHQARGILTGGSPWPWP